MRMNPGWRALTWALVVQLVVSGCATVPLKGTGGSGSWVGQRGPHPGSSEWENLEEARRADQVARLRGIGREVVHLLLHHVGDQRRVVPAPAAPQVRQHHANGHSTQQERHPSATESSRHVPSPRSRFCLPERPSVGTPCRKTVTNRALSKHGRAWSPDGETTLCLSTSEPLRTWPSLR